MDGFTAMQHIRQQQPDVRVLALTSFLDGARFRRALQAGAILLKDVQARDLADAIRAAYGSRSALAAERPGRSIEAVAQPAPQGEAPLPNARAGVLSPVWPGPKQCLKLPSN